MNKLTLNGIENLYKNNQKETIVQISEIFLSKKENERFENFFFAN